MKLFFRIVGIVVVVLILAALVLYFLNKEGFLPEPLSEWVNNMTLHCTGAANDTKKTYEEIVHDATDTPRPTITPTPTDAPSDSPDAAN